MKLIIFLAAVIGLGGCAGSAGRQTQTADYDLGIASIASIASNSPREGVKSPVMVREIAVQAPSWLETAAMQYRLGYADGSRRQVFAESRWAAPPAELLEVALRRGVAAGEGGSPATGCRLRIDLDEFVQVFDDPQASHAVLEARAMLMATRSDRSLARRSFSLRKNTATPDARGGVAAFAALSGEFGSQLAAWLATLAKDAPGVLDACAGKP